MILPEPRGDTLHQKGKAFFSTIVLVAVCYGSMLFGSFVVEKPSRQTYREVDLASFAPPEPDPEFIRSAEAAAPAEEADTDTEPAEPAAATQTLAQLDLSALFPGDAELSVETPDVNARAQGAAEGTTESQIAVQSGGLQGLGDIGALDNLAGAPVPAARGRSGRQTPGGSGNIALSGGTSSSAPQPAELNAGADVVGGNTSRAQATATAEVRVERLSLDSFGSDYDRLEVQELIDWMKKHPAELPIGVRQLVRHRPSFLSSVARFELEGKPYELYLMCKESLYEIHIVLVDAGESTYLVDRSFQKLSTYLSEGQVRRAQQGDITAIRSQRSAASNDASRDFYAIFLSWWEQAKTDA